MYEYSSSDEMSSFYAHIPFMNDFRGRELTEFVMDSSNALLALLQTYFSFLMEITN